MGELGKCGHDLCGHAHLECLHAFVDVFHGVAVGDRFVLLAFEANAVCLLGPARLFKRLWRELGKLQHILETAPKNLLGHRIAIRASRILIEGVHDLW